MTRDSQFGPHVVPEPPGNALDIEDTYNSTCEHKNAVGEAEQEALKRYPKGESAHYAYWRNETDYKNHKSRVAFVEGYKCHAEKRAVAPDNDALIADLRDMVGEAVYIASLPANERDMGGYYWETYYEAIDTAEWLVMGDRFSAALASLGLAIVKREATERARANELTQELLDTHNRYATERAAREEAERDAEHWQDEATYEIGAAPHLWSTRARDAEAKLAEAIAAREEAERDLVNWGEMYRENTETESKIRQELNDKLTEALAERDAWHTLADTAVRESSVNRYLRRE